MYISDLFTVVGYLHTAGFKNRLGIFCAKCMFLPMDVKYDHVQILRSHLNSGLNKVAV